VAEPAGLAEPLPEPWSALAEEWAAEPPSEPTPMAAAVGDVGGGVGFQASFTALDASLASADLWLPVDDLAATSADAPAPERHGEERHAAG
jgi:hypothetical protein